MLKMWAFVMMIDGQVQTTLLTSSEEHCRHAMSVMLEVQWGNNNDASGACYSRTSDIIDSNTPRTGSQIISR